MYINIYIQRDEVIDVDVDLYIQRYISMQECVQYSSTSTTVSIGYS